MSCHRTSIRLSAVLAVVALATGCGDGDSATAPPTPEPARPTTVTVSPATHELTALGITVQLSAEVRDQNARVMGGATVTWTSSASSMATVDASGLVTAAGNGTATITASAGSASGSAVVTVMQSVASVEVSPSAETIGLGSTLQLTAEAFDGNGHAVAGAEFSWESSDAAVATVDAGGLLTGVAEGVATITASAGEASGTAVVTVDQSANPDRAALVALYNATDGPNWYFRDNWLTDAPLGDWYGVLVEEGRVRGLYLPSNGLSGRIPAELGNLANLKQLNLTSNALTGPIPAELDGLADLLSLDLYGNDLTGSIPSELGDLAHLTYLNFASNDLTGPIPPEFGSLANLESLGLWDNALTGPIPPEFGSLASLEFLSLSSNALTDPLPRSLLDLASLRRFYFHGNEGLCAPGVASFADWLEGIGEPGPFCNQSDTGVLESLFEGADGPGWTNADGWLDTPALDEWYGVTADFLGRVVTLDLTDNGLVGPLPPDLGNLREMTRLRIGGNALSGRLPLSLARLSLVELRYVDTGLCAPAETEFRAWLIGIPLHAGTGMECAALSDRDILVALYNATGGPGWTRSNNWLTDASLGSWYGVSVDAEGRVVDVDLSSNHLVGPIPPELGALANLRRLGLYANDLSGPIPLELGKLVNLETIRISHNFNISGGIPAELGNLASLRDLELFETGLTGPIPPELGALANLESLTLFDNDLTGPLPPEFGNLTNLRILDLRDNKLTGPLPPELGNLTSLRTLSLADNKLTGPLPPELGNLTNLRTLSLANNSLMGPLPAELGNLSTLEELSLDLNDLSGPVPPEFGRMSRLQELALANNRGMAGTLPLRLTDLRRLERLLAGGTSLCAPLEPGFQAWLAGIHQRRIAPCLTGDRPIAYLTQAVQSREFSVPLVADEKALLRVFVTARKATSEGFPPVRARFYASGQEVHVEDLPGSSAQIPTEVTENSLAKSANGEIPGHVIQPGLEMVIEVDPDGTLDPELGVPKRIPETGRMAVDVREMPLFDLTVIPFLWTADPDPAIIDLTAGMATDPEGDDLLKDTRTLLPVASLDVRAHEPVLSSENYLGALLGATEAIRAMEGGVGHYLGMMSETTLGRVGIASTPGRSSVAPPSSRIIAHELGHNLSLFHSPCGGAEFPDPSFPYLNGSTGAWGYDFSDGGELVPPSHGDLMSYCEPGWISDYHFTNALRYRLFDEGASTAAATAASTRSLLLWGGVGADSVPFLEPAFLVDAPAALPDSPGEHTITGRTRDGSELFSFSFTMPKTADGDGSSSFAFVLPVQSGWEGNLAGITLTGPSGSVTLDGDSDLPMAILRNPRNGQVRGILRDLPPLTQATRDAAGSFAEPGLEVLFSRGIPDAAAWRR